MLQATVTDICGTNLPQLLQGGSYAQNIFETVLLKLFLTVRKIRYSL
jgi:hypothetical protein